MTNSYGEITQNISYIPYGEIFVEERNGAWSSPYLFNAKELDEETGLYYYGARYLDPNSTRWLSVDPMWEKYMGMTPYQYCHNNPVRMVDPDGNEDYFNEEGRYLGRVGNNEGLKCVNEKEWRQARKKAESQFGRTYKAAIDAAMSEMLLSSAKDIKISDQELYGFNGQTTIEFVKSKSDTPIEINGRKVYKEYGIDVVFNKDTYTFEFSSDGLLKGSPTNLPSYKKHKNGRTVANVHGHSANNYRLVAYNANVGDSRTDQDASISLMGVVMNIETTSTGEVQYHYYDCGGNLSEYKGGTDAKSIITFIVNKLAGK